MTLGPMEPSSTGRSTDLPVLLSVSVIVPLCAPTFGLLPSMDAPRSLRPRAIPGCGENKPPLADYQIAPQYCNAISQLRDNLTCLFFERHPRCGRAFRRGRAPA